VAEQVSNYANAALSISIHGKGEELSPFDRTVFPFPRVLSFTENQRHPRHPSYSQSSMATRLGLQFAFRSPKTPIFPIQKGKSSLRSARKRPQTSR
jgi:Tfp pilus assembly protein PilO